MIIYNLDGGYHSGQRKDCSAIFNRAHRVKCTLSVHQYYDNFFVIPKIYLLLEHLLFRMGLLKIMPIS